MEDGMRIILILAATTLAGSASAQEFVDRSDRQIPAHALEKLMASSLRHFADPDSTRFRDLKYEAVKGETTILGEVLTEDFIRGSVNTKNEFGAYTGYKPFRFGIDTNRF
jgi:hypothetical protein